MEGIDSRVSGRRLCRSEGEVVSGDGGEEGEVRATMEENRDEEDVDFVGELVWSTERGSRRGS